MDQDEYNRRVAAALPPTHSMSPRYQPPLDEPARVMTKAEIAAEEGALRAALTTSNERTTSMPRQRDPAVAAEADRFEATLKASRIPDALHDALWDVWVKSGSRAEALVARFKASATPAVTVKQAPPDPVEQAIERLRTAAQAAGQVVADDEITRQIDALVATLGRLTTPAGQQLQAQLKAAPGLDTNGLRFDGGGLVGGPVRTQDGKPLEEIKR